MHTYEREALQVKVASLHRQMVRDTARVATHTRRICVKNVRQLTYYYNLWLE